jgi:ABC-type uncharacterized transport system permease subunit
MIEWGLKENKKEKRTCTQGSFSIDFLQPLSFVFHHHQSATVELV